jgi:methionine synthase I (cobalamin-dependent)
MPAGMRILIVLETMQDINEVLIAVKAAKELTDLPVYMRQ